jgi:hypothetical protein
MNLTNVENHFRQQHQLLGNIADEVSFNMIYALIEQVRSQTEEIERLTALNRHYFFTFYNGDITKMKSDFHYLGE